MTINDLTINISNLEIETLLSDWEWLIGKEKFAILVTAMGCAFIEDINSGEIHFLDIDEGEMIQITDSVEHFQELLSDKEFVVDFFSVNLVGDIREEGFKLNDTEVYSLIQPIVLGGEYTLENIESTNAEVHFSLTGQIHKKVSDLPEGTLIDKVEVT